MLGEPSCRTLCARTATAHRQGKRQAVPPGSAKIRKTAYTSAFHVLSCLRRSTRHLSVVMSSTSVVTFLMGLIGTRSTPSIPPTCHSVPDQNTVCAHAWTSCADHAPTMIDDTGMYLDATCSLHSAQAKEPGQRKPMHIHVHPYWCTDAWRVGLRTILQAPRRGR